MLLVIVATASIAFGARPMSLPTVWHALTDYDPSNGNSIVVVDKRLPRTIIGLVVGAALGLAGALMQGLTRNPLADPGLLGVNLGASLAVVCSIAFLGVASVAGYVWFAFAGAAVASVVVYAIAARGREGATPVKLALAGAAVSAALGSLVTAVLLTNQTALENLRFWQVGALAGRDWPVLAQVGIPLAAGGVLALALARPLDSLALGEDVARGLGVRVGAVRAATAVAVVLLCGAATAAAGPIAFVGLVVPHVARRFAGSSHRAVLPLSALVAPILLVGCDVIGRIVAFPGEVEVGIVTAVVGAPVFIALIRRRRQVAL